MADLEIDELDVRRRHGFGFAPISDKLHVNDMIPEEGALVLKTVSQMNKIASPFLIDDASLRGRVTLGLPTDPALAQMENIEKDVENHLEQLENLNTRLTSDTPSEVKALEFPFLAWEGIKAGLLKEEITNRQLNGYIKQAEEHQKDIDLLLDLTTELTNYKDDANGLNDETKRILDELKARGIDLWKNPDGEINKEAVEKLKTAANNRIDNLKSETQKMIVTKIQPLMQIVSMILETVKGMIQDHKRLVNRTLDGMRGGR